VDRETEVTLRILDRPESLGNALVILRASFTDRPRYTAGSESAETDRTWQADSDAALPG